MRGQVVRIVLNKGFFFIRGDDDVERFGHATALLNADIADLQEGDQVEFEHADTPKGARANSIRVIVERSNPLDAVFRVT